MNKIKEDCDGFLCSAHQDGRLTLSEVLDNTEYIKMSTITDYGGMRVEEHDEL